MSVPMVGKVIENTNGTKQKQHNNTHANEEGHFTPSLELGTRQLPQRDPVRKAPT